MNLDIDKFKKKIDKLVANGSITSQTASTYYYCTRRLAEELKNNTVDASAIEKAINSKAGTRQEMMKYVSAIRKYEDEVLNKSKSLLFGEPEIKLFQNYNAASSNSKGKILKHSSDTVERKINGLRNEKLKYALRLQLKSGLRIKEIADVKKEDISFDGDKTIIHVQQGKGNKKRIVETIEDKYLVDKLKGWASKHEDGEKLFYSRNYLRKKATELGIPTHDLRRINAQKRFQKELDTGKDRAEAKATVKKQLGHEKIKTTNIYLRYRHKKA
ncbi:phage integrase family protein [Alkaliphilus pronyensis]|uniref:Phage integrase family protein n=1 Tax=Alkaliphilus pronyensis TaxID=1482732 RepID=A0A6I0FAT6_9FIRM|nr:tyrosine-type recombinase/integrase [Alkaliphilus pronyensis]KAB3535646.1 phage integrase family protein [Alkaliphilus pronyensis]